MIFVNRSAIRKVGNKLVSGTVGTGLNMAPTVMQRPRGTYVATNHLVGMPTGAMKKYDVQVIVFAQSTIALAPIEGTTE